MVDYHCQDEGVTEGCDSCRVDIVTVVVYQGCCVVMVDDHYHDKGVTVDCDSCRVDVVTVGVFVCTRDVVWSW